ncbi:MAG: DUF4252 domain-containing protein [Bacteroidota bacterium]
MKKLLVLTCLLFIPLLNQAQSKAIDALQKKYKGSEETFSVNVNGHLVRLLMWFDDQKEKDLKELMKGVNHVKMLRIPKHHSGMTSSEFQNLKADVRKEAFDELMSIRSDDGNVDILIKEKKDSVSEILLLANNADDFVVLALRGNINLDKMIKAVGKGNKTGSFTFSN